MLLKDRALRLGEVRLGYVRLGECVRLGGWVVKLVDLLVNV